MGNTQSRRRFARRSASIVVLLFFSASCSKFGNFWEDKSSVTPSNTVADATYSPPAGSYNTTQFVTIATTTSGAAICYTSDGVTTPVCDAAATGCTTGILYTVPVNVPATQTLMAIACKATMTSSAISSAPYTLDTTPPATALTAPAPATYVTNTQISYNNSTEACATATMTWTRTAGLPDGGSPHVQALLGSELTMGVHNAVTLTNNPTLVSGATYSIAYNCSDAAANAAPAVTVNNVTFDNVSPVISAVTPATAASVLNTQVSFSFSEACNSASITWTRTGGAPDGASPHVQALTGGELTSGAHNNITITNNPTLVTGSIYDIAFNCTDFAGQSAPPITQTSVIYDNIPPIISAVTPAASSFVNTTQISYTLNEACATAAISWVRTGGPADGLSPHNQALTGGELTGGAHNNITITNNPTLVSDVIYSISFTCADAAGNNATPVNVANVTYDNTNIVISGVAPASNAFVNNTQVSYTLSEACQTGLITWTRTGGAADGSSPHAQALSPGERTLGAHNAITLASPPTLANGAIYTVQFDCTDAAANAAIPITITNVTYDVTAPIFSAASPTPSAVVANQQVSYTLSEACATGTVNWTRTGGTADSNHNQGLTIGELTSGPHGPFTISNNPVLVSGAIYTISFDCTDAAGNAAPTLSRTNVTFDNTAPVVSIQNLKNNGGLFTNKVIAPASDNVALASVEYNLDGGGWNPATGPTPYTFTLPTGGSTWRDRTNHNVQVRATDTAGNVSGTASVFVKKGNNRDINGDGYEDMVVSAYKDTSFRGKAFIFLGGPSGIVSADTTTANTTLTGATTPTAISRFGRNFALGDFNGDGYADLAVSATVYNTNQGATYIFHGSSGGIASGIATTANQIITGNGTEAFSSPLLTADLNNDGYCDLVAGAVSASASLGTAYGFFGTATGIMQTTSTSAPLKINGEAASGQFSSSIVAGDFDNDGFTDIAIGAPAFSTNLGRAYMFYAPGGGFVPATINAVHPTNTITVGAANNFLGGSMAAGDINGDGASDLVMGGYGAIGSQSLLKVFYGLTASRPLQGNSATPATTILETTNSVFFTTSISIIDTNADGFDDVIVGAHGGTVNAGYAAIFYGQAGLLSVTLPSAAGYMRTGLTGVGEQFGRGVNTADVNGDGYPDLLVGANFFSTDIGKVFVFFSNASGPTMTASNTIGGLAGTEFGIAFPR